MKDQPQQPGELTNRAVVGFVWTFASSGGQVVLRLVVLMVLARLLTPRDFGLVATAAIVVGFLQTVATLGIGAALVQRAELEPAHLSASQVVLTASGLLFAGLVCLFAPELAVLFRVTELIPLVRALSISLVITGVAHVSESLLARELKFRRLAVIQLGSYFLGYGVVGISAAIGGLGVWALVAAQLSQVGLASVAFIVSKPPPVRLSVDFQAAIDLLRFGGWLTVAKVANSAALQGDNFVVSRWLGTRAIGLYNRAYQVMAMPANVLAQAMDRVLFPAMSSVQESSDKLANAFRRVLSIAALVTLPFSALMIVLAPEIVIVLLGDQWDGVVVPLQLLSLGTLFRLGYKIGAVALMAQGKVRVFALTQFVYAGSVITGAAIGSLFGLRGVALGVSGALAIQYLLVLVICLRALDIPWKPIALLHLRAIGFTAVVAGLCFGCAFFSRSWQLPALAVVGVLVGVVFVIALALVLVAPRMLGDDGRWWVETYLHPVLGKLRGA
jgi:PST family polysaccharide transporter